LRSLNKCKNSGKKFPKNWGWGKVPQFETKVGLKAPCKAMPKLNPQNMLGNFGGQILNFVIDFFETN